MGIGSPLIDITGRLAWSLPPIKDRKAVAPALKDIYRAHRPGQRRSCAGGV